MSEFDLIARIAARARTRPDVILGIGDDAALLQVGPGDELVVAMDTLNSGVHFPADTPADSVGWKALAVNLSDLAAMGATPAWCTLSLSLPEPDVAWLDAFLDGFLSLADMHGVALVGGDTTRGPLSICVTVLGSVARGRALLRSTARAGDDIWIAGTLGDAAAALAQWQAGDVVDDTLRRQLDRPVPLVEVGRALIGIAHACIDVSDGLVADLGHMCNASGARAHVAVDTLPCSVTLGESIEPVPRRALQATGGDDYALCFSAPAAMRERIIDVGVVNRVAMTRVGEIVEGSGVAVFDRDGEPWCPERAGHEHFAA